MFLHTFVENFTFSESALRLSINLSQKSENNGLSIFFRLALVLASTLTYNWVTGLNCLKKITIEWFQLSTVRNQILLCLLMIYDTSLTIIEP